MGPTWQNKDRTWMCTIGNKEIEAHSTMSVGLQELKLTSNAIYKVPNHPQDLEDLLGINFWCCWLQRQSGCRPQQGISSSNNIGGIFHGQGTRKRVHCCRSHKKNEVFFCIGEDSFPNYLPGPKAEPSNPIYWTWGLEAIEGRWCHYQKSAAKLPGFLLSFLIVNLRV